MAPFFRCSRWSRAITCLLPVTVMNTSPILAASTIDITPSPGEPPFVTPGDTIGEGQVLCTIEAMKMFNAIEAETGGAILEVLVAPGSEVEPGQPLFRIG